MRFAATYCVSRDPGRIESLGINNTVRVEFEADNEEHARDICALRRHQFLMPLLGEKSKDNGHG